MKITVPPNKEATVLYGVIQPGEVFKYGLRYGIKIHPLTDEDEFEIDAIDLIDGSHLYIAPCEKVVRVEAELIIS